MVEKGSVAVDGISLTISACDRGSFEVSVIPHTADMTTLGIRKVGDAVNIETDMIAKYVERLSQPFTSAKGNRGSGSVSRDDTLLAKLGY